MLTPNHHPVNKSGLVGWWDYMNTGSVSALGTWKDYSGNGNDGVGTGTVVVNNTGAVFNGTGYYQVPYNSVFAIGAGDFSLGFWLSINHSNFEYSMCQGTGSTPSTAFFVLHESTGITLAFRDTAGTYLTVSATSIPRDGTRTRIDYVKRGTTSIDVYVNSELQSSAAYGNGTFMARTEDFYIGVEPGGSPPCNGIYDGITWYNRALSAGEIKQNYYKNLRA